MIDISVQTVIVTFFAGVFMFLAPCTFPLIPAFLASLVQNGNQRSWSKSSNELTLRAVFFALGFTLIFVTFGLLSGYIGSTLIQYKSMLSTVGGFIIIIFGLVLLGILRLPPFLHRTRIASTIRHHSNSRYSAFIFGIMFALGWTPCAGPILASILILAAQSSTAFHAGILLLIFSLGLAIPFIIMGIVYDKSLKIISTYARYIQLISIVSGMTLIIFGVILLFGHSFRMTVWGMDLYNFFGYSPQCSYF